MGQGFGDEIGKAIIRFMVLVAVVSASLGAGIYFLLSWIVRHLAVNWR